MIRSVRIKNFKSIQDTGKVSLGRINALFGKNGAGKSNFIGSFKLLKSLTSGEKLSDITKSIAPMEVEFFKWGDFSNRSFFEFQIESSNSKHYIYNFTVGIVPSNVSSSLEIIEENFLELESSGSDNHQVIFKRDKESITFGNDTDKELSFNINTEKTFLSEYKHISTEDLIATISNYAFIDEHIHIESGFRAVNINSTNSNKMDDVAADLAINNPEAFQKAVEVVKKILDNFEAPIVSPISNSESENLELKRPITRESKLHKFYFVLWRSRYAKGSHTYHSLSGGERRIIHLVFNLFASKQKSLFIVEEIESGIHFALIKRLMDEFKTQAYNHKIQVLFTTHSPDILSTVAVNEIIWIKTEKDKGTIAINLKDTKEFEQISKDFNEDVKGVIMSGMFD